MKPILLALSLFALCAVSRSATPLTDVKLSGTGNEVKSTAIATVNGTLTVGAAGTLSTTSGATITLADPLAIANGGTGAATASAARTALGLGTIATAAATDYVAAAASPAAGDIPYFDGDDWVSLTAGTDDQVLTLADGIPSWADAPTGFTNPMSAAGDLIYGGTSGTATRLAKGTAGQVLTMNSGATAPEWGDVPERFTNPMTTAGDLIVGGSSGAADRLGVGSDGQVLKVVGGALAWATDSTGTGTLPASPTAGDIAYFDGSDWSSLGIGTAGQVLTTNTGATAPEWADASGGGGSGSLTLARFTALDNQPPASSYATFDTRNSIAVLDFDADTEESAVFIGIMPEGADLTAGISVRIHWTATSATSGEAIWTTAFERSNTDLDSDSFATALRAGSGETTSPTSGIVTVTAIDHSGSEIDGITAGDLFRLRLTRDATNGSDSMTGDAEVIAVEIRQR